MCSIVERLCELFSCRPSDLPVALDTPECVQYLREHRYRISPEFTDAYYPISFQGLSASDAYHERLYKHKSLTVAQCFSRYFGIPLTYPYLPCMLEYLPYSGTINKFPIELFVIEDGC